MFIQLKSYYADFLKIQLTHLDDAGWDQFTTCVRLNWTLTGLKRSAQDG